MRDRRQEIILGAVVFFAAVILVVGTVWLSERYAGAAGGYRIHAKFDSVPGLQVGNPVTFRGVKVGKVLSITLEDGLPFVALGFATVRDLPVDSRFLLKSDGLLGGQMIEIQLGESEQRLPDGAVVEGISASDLDAMVSESRLMIEKIRNAVDGVASDNNLAHLESVLARIDTTTYYLNRLLNDDNLGKVDKMLDSLAVATGDASGLMRDNRENLSIAVTNIAVMMERLARISAQMESTSVAMQNTFVNLDDISKGIRDGRGTVGRLVKDEAVYEHLDRTLTSVDSLIEDIKRNPKRYLHISIF
ncbi:MAG: MlaD family protein [Gemmatimonadetes bacterium]|nr:MlaD family protein [Gemmatimonadota bacterium]